MGTDNPKVSAYVPQALKDRLKEFRDERNGISESQAVIIILADYFQMPEVLGRSPEAVSVGGVTLARMEALEQEFGGFTKLVEQRLQELTESIKRLSEPQVDQSKPQEEVIDSQRAINQFSEPLNSSESVQLELHQVKEASDGSLLNEPPVKIEQTAEKDESVFVPLSELLSEPLEEISPIPSRKLSKLRFGLAEAGIAGIKRKKSLEDFTNWTKEKDRDHIAWKYVESPSKGYVPAEELSSEQKSSLLKWIKENLQ